MRCTQNSYIGTCHCVRCTQNSYIEDMPLCEMYIELVHTGPCHDRTFIHKAHAMTGHAIHITHILKGGCRCFRTDGSNGKKQRTSAAKIGFTTLTGSLCLFLDWGASAAKQLGWTQDGPMTRPATGWLVCISGGLSCFETSDVFTLLLAETIPQRSALVRHANSFAHRAAIQDSQHDTCEMVLVNGSLVALDCICFGRL